MEIETNILGTAVQYDGHQKSSKQLIITTKPKLIFFLDQFDNLFEKKKSAAVATCRTQQRFVEIRGVPLPSKVTLKDKIKKISFGKYLLQKYICSFDFLDRYKYTNC